MDKAPVVVNIYRDHFDVDITRSGFWGNPYIIGKHGTRGEVIELYEKWVRSSPRMLKALADLTGKRLGCVCKPKACHGDVLVRLWQEIYGNREGVL